MLEKLKTIEARLMEVERQLSDPAVYGDRDRLTALSREQKELTPIVTAYRAYVRASQTAEDAAAMLSDPELRELAQEELAAARADTERLEDELMGLRFRLSPLSFYQVNRVQTERLYGQALEFAALSGGETVVDAYCGAGTIGLCMARKAGRVVGIEIVPDAVRDAKENAARNGVGNAEFLAGACEDVLPRLVEDGLRPDVAVLDPPRKGCEPAVLEAVARSAPRRIVYVSCNPATLARDAKRLAELGYPLRALRPCDMFPWTGEVETVVLLQASKV